MHKGLKRNFQLMPGPQWLELLCRHIPDWFEHLVRYVGWYSTRVRGTRAPKAVPRAAAPAGARACYVLAHGAGAGMAHPFMASVAQGLAERGVATLRYQFPYMERGSKREGRNAGLVGRLDRRGDPRTGGPVARGMNLFFGRADWKSPETGDEKLSRPQL